MNNLFIILKAYATSLKIALRSFSFQQTGA